MMIDDIPRAVDPKTMINWTVTLAMMWEIEAHIRAGRREGDIAFLMGIDRAKMREIVTRNRLPVIR